MSIGVIQELSAGSEFMKMLKLHLIQIDLKPLQMQEQHYCIRMLTYIKIGSGNFSKDKRRRHGIVSVCCRDTLICGSFCVSMVRVSWENVPCV